MSKIETASKVSPKLTSSINLGRRAPLWFMWLYWSKVIYAFTMKQMNFKYLDFPRPPIHPNRAESVDYPDIYYWPQKLTQLLNYWPQVWWTWKETFNILKIFLSFMHSHTNLQLSWQFKPTACVRPPIAFDNFIWIALQSPLHIHNRQIVQRTQSETLTIDDITK